MIPGRGTRILQAAQHGQKHKNKNRDKKTPKQNKKSGKAYIVEMEREGNINIEVESAGRVDWMQS